MAKEWIVFSGAGPAGPRGEQGPSGSVGTPAPNITSATGVPAYSLIGHDTVVSFSGVITLPTGDPHYADLALIEVYAYPPSKPAILIATVPAAMFGAATVAYSGGQIPQPTANQTGWKLEFVCYNPGGSPTPTPVAISSITVQGAAVTAVNDAGENPANRTLEENNLTACYPSFVPVLNGNQVPQTVTYWLSKDNGSTYTHIGWIFITSVGQTVNFSTLAPLAAQNWKIAASAGAVPGDPSVAIPAAALPATAVVSAAFAVSGLAAPAAMGITDASIGTTTYAQSPEGGWSYGQKGISLTIPADEVNLWDVWLTVQLGRVVGGVFEGDPNTAEGQERIVKTWTEAGAAVTHSVAGWWIPPTDYSYRVHRWRLRIRNRAEVLTLQAQAWSGADHVDVTPDPHAADDYSFAGAPVATPGPDGVTVRFTPVPPGDVTSLGGFMVQVELPDQSSTPPTLSDGSVLSDGSRLSVGLPEPRTFGPYQYSADQLPIEVTVRDPGYACNGRVRIASISQAGIQKPWITAPSATFTYTPETTPAKPESATAYAPLVGGITAVPGTPMNRDGKLQTPVACAITDIPTADPTFYGYEIVSVWRDGAQHTHSGVLCDPVTTVWIWTPASVQDVIIYARSCSIDAAGNVRRNPIVVNLTPFDVVTLGTTSGTLDLGAAIATSVGQALQLLNDKLQVLFGDGLAVDGDDALVVNAGDGIELAAGAVKAKTGDGLELLGGAIKAKTGDGLELIAGAIKAKTGDGLELSGGAVKVKTGSGLELNGGAVQANLGNGLTANAGAITLNLGNGLKMTGAVLEANLGNGLTLAGSAITLSLGTGLEMSGAAVQTKLGNGLTTSLGAITLNLGAGLTMNGMAVQANLGNGLTTSAGAITLSLGNGLTMSGSSVAVNAGNGISVAGGTVTVSTGDGLTIAGGVVKANLGNGVTSSGGAITLNLGSGLTMSGSVATVNAGGGLTLSGIQLVIATNGVTNDHILSLNVDRLNADGRALNVGSGGMTVNGSGGISLTAGNFISLVGGVYAPSLNAANLLGYGWQITGGYSPSITFALASSATINATEYRVSGSTVMDSGRSLRNIADLVMTGWVYVNGTAVLKGQQAGVTDPVGGSVVDVECRAQLSSLLSRLESAGILASA